MLTLLLKSTLSHTLMISAFVLTMMIMIEYINIQTKNVWFAKIQKSPFAQIMLATGFGLIPGCLGTFTAVSLYTHRMIGFGALVALMIATSGDEAFVMFALFPGKALLLHLTLFFVAVIAGWLVHKTTKVRPKVKEQGFVLHSQEVCKCYSRKLIVNQLRNITWERFLLLFIVSVFIIMLITGAVGPAGWHWKKITFLTGSLFLLFVSITVPNHFLKEHICNHIIKKHLLRLVLWTWAAFVALHFLESGISITEFLHQNTHVVLIVAVLMGIIPESGPHLILVTLFAEGHLPFSILLANSIVQDGHGMLPLLAESRIDFFRVKAINLFIGYLVGALFLLAGY